MKSLPDQILFFGGTGQAKVCRPIVEHYGSRVIAVIDDTPKLATPFSDVPLFEGWEKARQFILDRKKMGTLGFAITIGNPNGRVRLKLHEKMVSEGLVPVNLIHPTAFIERNAKLGTGIQIMAGAIIGAEAQLKNEVIVNTKASVDHECILEDGSEVAPGGTLCGIVRLQVNAWIGAGATVLPRITVGEDAIVGAGSVVIRDVASQTTVVGIPAQEIGKSKSPSRNLAKSQSLLPDA